MALPPTPSQTIGPFFHFSLPYPGGEHLVSPANPAYELPIDHRQSESDRKAIVDTACLSASVD